MDQSSNTSLAKDDIIEWDNQSNEDETQITNLLVAKLWCSKPVNIKATIDTMCRLWKAMQINVVGNVLDLKSKTFLFSFEETLDKTRVLDGQPWHFDNYIWCFNEPNPNTKMSEVSLTHVPFWIRVYDLPFQGRSNVENARRIGNSLGGFVDFDSSVLHPKREVAMRIRVLHDVRVPLKKDISIRMTGGCVSRFLVKYEKLPLFCYGCGVLGHGLNHCENGPYEEGTHEFGPWNMVFPRKPAKRETVKDGGNNVKDSTPAMEEETRKMMGFLKT